MVGNSSSEKSYIKDQVVAWGADHRPALSRAHLAWHQVQLDEGSQTTRRDGEEWALTRTPLSHEALGREVCARRFDDVGLLATDVGGSASL